MGTLQAVTVQWALALHGGDVPQLGAARLWVSVPALTEMWEVEVCAEAGECCPFGCPQGPLRKGEKVRWSEVLYWHVPPWRGSQPAHLSG